MKAVVTLAQGPKAVFIERLDHWGKWLYAVASLANLLIAPRV